MGSSNSKSKSTNTYDTTVVNNNDLKLLNESVNDFTANVVVDQASQCSAHITQLQSVDFSNMHVAGDVDIGEIDQSQKAAMTFDCLQVSAFKNDIASGIMSQYTNAIQNSYSTAALAEMATAAKASSQNQFASTGSSNSDSDSNNSYKFTNVNNTNQDIQNIVKNSITNNLNMKDIQDCIADITSKQSVSLAGAEIGGNLNIRAIKQDQAATLMAKCVQKRDNGNKISNEIATKLGVQISSEAKTTSGATMSATSSATSENVGALQSFGSMVGSILKGFGDLLGGIFGGLLSGYAALAVVCGCFCLMSCCCCYAATQMGGGGLKKNESFDPLLFVTLVILFVVILQQLNIQLK